jgi:hypothetical protein
MDRIIKITLGLFIAILVATIAFAGYSGYISGAYDATRTGTYSYMFGITTDHALSGVTLFIPVPADSRGNSPVVSQYSAQAMPGIPASWQTTLYDTGKATLLKIYIPELILPAGTGPDNPYTITIKAELPSETTIDTANPIANSPVFGTIQNVRQVACTGYGTGAGGSPECSTFTTTLYADYTADPNTAVTITSAITGTNRWTVLEPQSNEYTSVISVLMHGENHAWATVKGTLVSHIGSYDYPFHYP